MPDTKLTLSNLREHLRKCLAAYLAVIVAAVALTELLWTVTRPQIPDDRAVLVYLAAQHTNAEALDAVAEDMLNRCKVDFPELESVEFQGLLFLDPEENYTGLMLLMTRLSTGEGDAFIANQSAMDALVNAGACLPLDAYLEAGWMSGHDLEPYRGAAAGIADAPICGLRLDSLDALSKLGAFDNEGAFLAVAVNGHNVDSTLRALQIMVEDLEREGA